MAIKIKTDTQIKKHIKNHAGGNAAYQIEGFSGLELYIRDNKTSTFRHRYTSPVTGKRPYYTIGTYPYMSLDEARDKYSSNVKLIKDGIDPMMHDDAIKSKSAAMPTFAQMANEWLQGRIASKNFEPRTIEQKRNHVKYASAHLGKMPLDAIKTPDVLRAIKDIERETIPTAKRVRGVCQHIFALAIGQGYIDNNPAIAVSDLLLPKPKTEHHSAIVEPVKFGQLLRDIDAMTDFYGHAQNIIKLQALLFQRSSDMCSMRWSDIDFDAKTWTFSPAKVGSRGDMVSSLIVPLPVQALNILRALYQNTGDTEYVFYNSRRKTKYEHPQQLNKFLNSLGYKDIHRPHGFRASAITMIQEQLKYPNYLPDMQSGHKVKDSNGEAYNRAQFLDERREMMQKWADYLDGLKIEA